MTPEIAQLVAAGVKEPDKWLSAIQQTCDPETLAIRFIEHEVSVKIPDSHCAGEVWVCDLGKHVCACVVDVALRIGGNEDLSAVIRHADRAIAGHIA